MSARAGSPPTPWSIQLQGGPGTQSLREHLERDLANEGFTLTETPGQKDLTLYVDHGETLADLERWLITTAQMNPAQRVVCMPRLTRRARLGLRAQAGTRFLEPADKSEVRFSERILGEL